MPDRLRVLHAIHDFLPRHRAGSEIYAYELARRLAGRHHVWVLCAESDPSRAHGAVTWRAYDGLPVVELVNNWAFATFEETYRSPLVNQRLRHVLAAIRPDVVHVHNLLNLSMDLPALARGGGAAVVATLHDYTLVCPSGGQRVHAAESHVCAEIDTSRCARCFPESPFHTAMAVNRLAPPAGLAAAGAVARGVRRAAPRLFGALLDLARRAPGPPLDATDLDRRLEYAARVYAHVDLFVSPSAALAREFTRLGLPPEKIRVSDNGLPRLEARRRPSADGRLRVRFGGTLVWHKGAHVLVDAVRRLPADRVDVRIHGDSDAFPAYASRLRAAAQDLPVRFMGVFDGARAGEVYGDLDVLVVPSLWPENSPLVIHEAFMAGVPVVGSRQGGIPELVTDGVNGLLYDAFSAEALSAALGSIVAHPERLDAFRAALPAVKTADEDAEAWHARYLEAVAAARSERARRTAAALAAGEPPGRLGASPAPEEQGRAGPLRSGTPTAPLVSIVIPTLDGAATLPGLLDAIAAQRTDLPVEIVAVDSGSTDGTVDLLRGRVGRLVQVERAAFDHGLTRNLGVEAARGDLVVLTVQDAVPASPYWLAALVAPLLEDTRLAGTYARQVPRPDASALTRSYLTRWAAASPDPRPPQRLSPETFAGLAPPERLHACVFDNVCSCIRRSVWADRPFRSTPIAEDLEWARDVLLAGHALAYVPAAVVVHSHDRSARYELARTRLLHARLGELFDLGLVPDLPSLVRAIASTTALHLRLAEWSRPRAAARALALAVAWPLGQYLGARDARRAPPPGGAR